jgi:hypothetical protein
MMRLEILDESVSWPFSLVPRSGSHRVPPSVVEFGATVKPWHLIGWNDGLSSTIGFTRKHQAVIVEGRQIVGLSICFMRRAKGPGFVSLEAKLQGESGQLVLLEVRHFDEVALNWLRGKAQQLESLFDAPITYDDFGADY